MNYKTNLLFLLLVIFVITQDGGYDGGDSGGGSDSGGYDSGGYDSGGYDSGSGGYDSGSGGYDSGGSYDSGSGSYDSGSGSGNYTGTTNCDSRCGLIVGLVFGILIGTPIFIIYLIKFIRCIKERQLLRQAEQQQISQQPVVILQETIKNNDVVCPKYNQEEFDRISEVFSGIPWKFTYTQLQNSFNVDNITIKMNKQTDNNYKLIMSGADKFGSWTSSGYFRNTDKIQLWMKKQYDNKKKAHQGGKWSNLIYEGYMNDAGNYNGRWYFLGFQNDKKYSGQWSMNYEINKSYEINSNYQIKTDINKQTIV